MGLLLAVTRQVTPIHTLSNTLIMPELTEVLDAKLEEVSNDNDSGTDSDGDDDSIPELEETTGEAGADTAVAGAAGAAGDDASKAKQSRGEKKSSEDHV